MTDIIRFSCSGCGVMLKAPEAKRGSLIDCPKCEAVVVIDDSPVIPAAPLPRLTHDASEPDLDFTSSPRKPAASKVSNVPATLLVGIGNVLLIFSGLVVLSAMFNSNPNKTEFLISRMMIAASVAFTSLSCHAFASALKALLRIDMNLSRIADSTNQ